MPADMRHFRELTLGKPIIMGHKTFLSIGRPLPNRVNIILTRDLETKLEGCQVVHSPEEALQAVQGNAETMIIGGEKIYQLFLPQADRLYLTYIEADVDGDTFFPAFDSNEWREIAREPQKADAENKYDYTFVTLERT